MPSLTFLLPDGSARTLPSDGMPTVMHVAVRENLPSVIAECGGACACATCHVYVDEAWLWKLTPKTDDEDDLLYTAPDVKSNSRLSCQILLSDELDGLKVTLAQSARQ